MEQYKLDQLPSKELIPGYHVKFVHSENMTFAWWNIEAGHSLPSHNHRHEQVLNLLEGRFEVTIKGKPQILEAGAVVVIPSNIDHSGKAITDCRILDVFYPVRDDYR